MTEAARPKVYASALFKLALFYGFARFGGGYSVLAQLRRDLVEKRKWLSADEFLVLAELSKSLPGTPATNLLTLLGQRVGGLRGGVAAATAFLLPSMVLMMACGFWYERMRSLAGLAVFFDGMSAAMVGVVAATTLDLGRSALRDRWDVLAAAVATVLLATRVATEPMIALLAIGIGVVAAVRNRTRNVAPDAPAPKSERLHSVSPIVLLLWGGASAGVLAALARVFVPIGVATFGGGLAMIPGIEHEVVAQQHWLDARAFSDAIALGQITPGPVAICATFIGFRVGGVAGGLVATVAMFGPAIALALAVGHSVERFRRSAIVESALRALAPAVIGMLAAATWSLGRASLDHWLPAGVALVSFVVLARVKVSPIWALVGGGLVLVAAAHLHG